MSTLNEKVESNIALKRKAWGARVIVALLAATVFSGRKSDLVDRKMTSSILSILSLKK